ncbi:MAG: hypothetical protein J6Q68_03165 [Clostridia bacterium]|nr:hypothetical protein [Clostridia bacterium]
MEIYKRSINVTTASESFVYDGLFHTISPNAENILVHTYSDIPALCENHTVKILSVVTLRFVGDVDNVPDYIKIYDELGTDVTENYEINEFYGKLSVTHRPITVTMLDGIWEYNGKIHTGASLVPYFDMEYTGDAQKSPLASGESITIESIGEIKNVGLISHTAGGITISDGTENTTFNYDINIVDGSLEVYPRKVTLASLGATKVYDAEPLTRHMYEIISGSLIDGHELFVEFSGTRTDAGNSENTFFASAVMEGLDDIIKNYEFTYQNGVLEVTQRPITLVANSKTYVYDGYYKYGVDAGYYILDPTSLLTSHGHTVEVLSDSAIIDVGTLDNAISKVIITANNLDVTKNYLVSTEIGKLTVTQREIVIITTDVSKVYDGTALESGSLDSLYMYYAPNGVIDDSTFAISPADIAFAEKCYITYVSESGMENTYRIISLKRSETNSDVIGNYIISYNFGIMSITKKDITVSAKDHTFVYNGEYQSAPENDNVAFDQFELGAGNPYIEAQTKGSIKNVGSTEHTLDSVFIFLSDGTDVTENFNITKNSGTLTVIQRDITVITHSLEKIYDGTPLDTTFAFDVFGLVEGHRVSNWTLTDLIEVGTVDNVIVITEIRNGSENVTPNYNINYEYGTLKIISGKITVETDSAEKVYDGTPLTKNNGSWSGELLSGHSVSLTVIGSITNAGSIENGYSIKITNGDEDVTYMYKVIENLGTLTVTKKDITAYSASDEKTYDGTALTKQQLERVDGLVSGHSVSSVEYSGKQIDVGSSPNYFNVKVIIDAEGNDVTGNYNVIMSEGTLTVTKRAITVSTANAEKIFDGTPLTNGQWNISLGSLVNNQQLTVTVTGSITEVGTAENTFTAEVFANDGTNVSGNYEISADNGILRVISGEILIVTGSDSKTYDATALECLDAYFEGELLSGHTVKIYPVGMQIVPGTSENIFKYEILDENGVVIQSESTPFDEHIYSIAALHGELTVTPIGIEIVTESANKRYDGTPLTHHVYEIIGTVLEGHYVVVNVTGSRTEVGTSDNTFTYQIFDSDGVLIHSSDSTGEFNFYNVLQTFGELTVVSSTKTTVTAQSFDVRKEYDGLPIDNGIVVLNGELASGHRFVYEFVDVSDRILPFKAENKFTCKILDEDGNDVSDEYYVEKIFGELEIEKIKIEITTGSASKFYDGTPLTYEIYTHTGGILLDGHKIIISFTGSQTEVGTSDNTADAYVADADGNRLDEIYDEVSLVFGELTVIKPKVVISPYELQKKYTGEAHVYSNYYSNSWRNVWVSEGKEYLPAGYMIEAEVSGERTKVGETALTVKWVRIYDKDGNDITETFEVVTEESVLTVLKINITISSDSKTKEYDGQSLKAPNHYISVGELFKGHTYTATVDKAVVRPGTYENTIKNVVIIDSATGEDVTDYYEITLDHGTLTITEVDE